MQSISFAFVHHANQLNITDGYEDRDGIHTVCDGFLAVLELHRTYGIPTSLHISGTLIEAALWHRRDFLEKVTSLAREGVVAPVGGTYSEPIMPVCSEWSNERQLTTASELHRRHLGVPGGQPPTAWLPERVWSPELSRTLLASGVRRVLVDDRVLASPVLPDGYPAPGSRASADLAGPYRWDPHSPPSFVRGLVEPELLRPRLTIDGLTLVPMCSLLRYLIPPRSDEHLTLLEILLDDIGTRCADHPDSVLVYADDMERAAGVGGWEPALRQYEDLLRFLADRETVEPVALVRWGDVQPPAPPLHVPAGALEPVALDRWLDVHPPAAPMHVPAGTYYELEVEWGAGPDYRGWSDAPAWSPYRMLLAEVEDEVRAASEASDARLVALAERTLLIAQHETAWQDVDGDGRAPAPWVRATAAHARLARPLLAAACWASSPEPFAPSAGLDDVDGDGDSELILASDDAWCLVSPGEGARVTMMAHRRPGEIDTEPCPGLVVGNPLDHWNFQEELHRYMDRPAGHPGALADRATVHRRWDSLLSIRRPDAVGVDLRPCSEPSSESRRYALRKGVPALMVCLHVAEPGRRIENVLVPDYLDALVGGSHGLSVAGGERWRGWRCRGRQCWVGFDPAQADVVDDEHTVVGHGRPVTVVARGTHLDLLVGAGPVHDAFAARWIGLARDVLHAHPGPASMSAADGTRPHNADVV